MLKYLIAIPCLDSFPTPTVASMMAMRRVDATKLSFLSNSLVYDARNMLAAEAVDTGADRVLWLDSDMRFTPDLMERLAEDMDAGLDFVSALFFKRKLPVVPVLGKSLNLREEDGRMKADVTTYLDYPKDSLFEIAAAGFGAVMCSTKMIQDVFDTFGNPFDPIPGVLGEDYAFCWRASQLGYKLYCDSRIKAHHVGLFSYGEEHYVRKEDNGTA